MTTQRLAVIVLLGFSATAARGQGYTSQMEFSEQGRLLTLTYDGTEVGYRFEYTEDGGISSSIAGVTNVSTEPTSPGYTNALIGNYPNPFNPSTEILFEVARQTAVRIHVFDVLGRRVATVVDGIRAPGRHTAPLTPGRLAPGTYFYRLEAGAFSETRAMVVVR